MTPAQQKAFNWISVSLLSAIVAVVSAWTTTTFRVSLLEEQVKEIAGRVTAIYCSTVPAPQRDACR